MSPGFATSSTLCTIRLSPGNTFTVHAGPQSRRCLPVRQTMLGSTAYSRLSRSEISGVGNSANFRIKSGSKRSRSALIRKPGPGNISADRGFLAPTSTLVIAVALIRLLDFKGSIATQDELKRHYRVDDGQRHSRNAERRRAELELAIDSWNYQESTDGPQCTLVHLFDMTRYCIP